MPSLKKKLFLNYANSHPDDIAFRPPGRAEKLKK